jgi:hypothetical protein
MRIRGMILKITSVILVLPLTSMGQARGSFSTKRPYLTRKTTTTTFKQQKIAPQLYMAKKLTTRSFAGRKFTTQPFAGKSMSARRSFVTR